MKAGTEINFRVDSLEHADRSGIGNCLPSARREPLEHDGFGSIVEHAAGAQSLIGISGCAAGWPEAFRAANSRNRGC
jgi:hypothetical protein